MRLSTLRRPRSKALPGITAIARVDRRTSNLAKRIFPGEIAVIDHVDIDRATAVSLVEAGVVAVVNAAPSISGRYPNLGPALLVDAGVVLLDDVGGHLLAAIQDGQEIRVAGVNVYIGEDVVGTGTMQSRRSVEAAMEQAKSGIATQLEAVSASAVEQLRREQPMLIDQSGIPMLAKPVKGRQVLVVAKAFDYARDLASLKTYLRENHPVLVGVDAGADALMAAGHRPDVIVTDGEHVSDAALRCGAEVVVKAAPEGRVTFGDRIERLGVRHATFCTSSTTEDAALLLARANSASLIVTAGMPAGLEELLDTGRSSMASSFLTRASLGTSVVDAKAVAQLYRPRVHGLLLLVLVLVGLAAVGAAIATTPVGQDWWDQVHTWLVDGYDWVRRQVT
jgi:uncharacterized membrane-anchored protein